MKGLTTFLAGAALGAALVAARYWYRSSRLPVPSFRHTPDERLGGDLDQIVMWSAFLNKNESIWTGVASVLGAASTIAGAFQ
jgi:hypothetical protein